MIESLHALSSAGTFAFFLSFFLSTYALKEKNDIQPGQAFY